MVGISRFSLLVFFLLLFIVVFPYGHHFLYLDRKLVSVFGNGDGAILALFLIFVEMSRFFPIKYVKKCPSVPVFLSFFFF
jgi:hypothetical protein